MTNLILLGLEQEFYSWLHHGIPNTWMVMFKRGSELKTQCG